MLGSCSHLDSTHSVSEGLAKVGLVHSREVEENQASRTVLGFVVALGFGCRVRCCKGDCNLG